jgi:hypothetical protein
MIGSVYSVRRLQRGVRTTRLLAPILQSYSGPSPRRCWISMVKHAVARTSGLHHGQRTRQRRRLQPATAMRSQARPACQPHVLAPGPVPRRSRKLWCSRAREAFVRWTLACGPPSRGIEPLWRRHRPKPRRRRVRTRGRCDSARHLSLADLKVANVVRPTVQTASDVTRLMSCHLRPTLHAGVPRLHHLVSTLSADIHRPLDVLAVSMRAHLETELFVTRRRPVLRVSVPRIRDPWWVGRNVHHAHLEDLREVVDGSWLIQTVATQYPVT